MYGTYCRLDVPVWANDLEVIRAARRKLSAEAFLPCYREGRKRFYRQMLEFHHASQSLCKEFTL